MTILSNEPTHPYERPPLSKDYLTGKTAAEDLAINPAGWYADHGVESCWTLTPPGSTPPVRP